MEIWRLLCVFHPLHLPSPPEPAAFQWVQRKQHYWLFKEWVGSNKHYSCKTQRGTSDSSAEIFLVPKQRNLATCSIQPLCLATSLQMHLTPVEPLYYSKKNPPGCILALNKQTEKVNSMIYSNIQISVPSIHFNFLRTSEVPCEPGHQIAFPSLVP